MTGAPTTPGLKDPEVEGDVHIRPVYLAGADWVGDTAFHPLLALGTRTHHDDLGNYYVSTVEGRIRVAFIPEQDWDTLWKIAVHTDAFSEPVWVANFSADAPTEIVTAVTTELAAMYRADEDSWIHARRPGVLESLAPYAAARWTWDTRSGPLGDVAAKSPDGHAQVRYSRTPLTSDESEQAGQDGRYTLCAGGSHEGWYGRFSSATPARILAAAAGAMLDSAPVARYRDFLSPYARRNATITPILPPPTPLDVHRSLAARTRSAPLALRSTPAARPAVTLAWSTATPATAPAGARITTRSQ
ncbi:DUF317 domain-containing protein [Kitasatospora purpeofusca]|uniref:DUF317 domain-containing protein n=1 Tax=Kitasatospora purpeofusca TaxID=67352 RepID=UPI0035DF1BB1